MPQRVPFPANTFLVDPRNRPFIEGKAPGIELRGAPSSGGIVIAGAAASPCLAFSVLQLGEALTTGNSDSYQLACAALFIPLLAGFYFVVWFRGMLPIRRLKREGLLLKGEVVRCSSEFITWGDGPDFYSVKIEYIFATPPGSKVNGSEGISVAPKAYDERSLPQAGSPVAVIWVNESLYQML